MRFSDKLFSLVQRDVLLVITTILTGSVIARTLGPEMMGLWTILLLIPGYAEAFGRLKLDVSSIYFIGKKKASIGEMTALLHVASLFASLLIIGFIFWQFEWCYSQLFSKSTINMRNLVYASLTIIPLRLVHLNYGYLHIAREDVRSYNTMVIAQAIVTSMSSIGLILVFSWGILGALAGSISGLVVSITYGAVKLRRIEKMKFRFNPSLFAEMFKYGSHQYVSGIVGYFQSTVTHLLATSYLIPVNLGYYALGKSIAELSTRMIPTSVNLLLYPRVSKSEDKQEMVLLIARSFRVMLVILCATALALVPTIKVLIFILYGPKYYPMIGPFLIILPAFVISQASSVFISYFSGTGRADLLTKISVLPLLLQIGLALILVPRFGVMGAATAFLLSTASLSVAQLLVFLKLSNLPKKTLFPQINDLFSISSALRNKVVHLRMLVDLKK